MGVAGGDAPRAARQPLLVGSVFEEAWKFVADASQAPHDHDCFAAADERRRCQRYLGG